MTTQKRKSKAKKRPPQKKEHEHNWIPEETPEKIKCTGCGAVKDYEKLPHHMTAGYATGDAEAVGRPYEKQIKGEGRLAESVVGEEPRIDATPDEIKEAMEKVVYERPIYVEGMNPVPGSVTYVDNCGGNEVRQSRIWIFICAVLVIACLALLVRDFQWMDTAKLLEQFPFMTDGKYLTAQCKGEDDTDLMGRLAGVGLKLGMDIVLPNGCTLRGITLPKDVKLITPRTLNVYAIEPPPDHSSSQPYIKGQVGQIIRSPDGSCQTIDTTDENGVVEHTHRCVCSDVGMTWNREDQQCE